MCILFVYSCVHETYDCFCSPRQRLDLLHLATNYAFVSFMCVSHWQVALAWGMVAGIGPASSIGSWREVPNLPEIWWLQMCCSARVGSATALTAAWPSEVGMKAFWHQVFWHHLSFQHLASGQKASMRQDAEISHGKLLPARTGSACWPWARTTKRKNCSKHLALPWRAQHGAILNALKMRHVMTHDEMHALPPTISELRRQGGQTSCVPYRRA